MRRSRRLRPADRYRHDDAPTAEEAARKAFKEAGIVRCGTVAMRFKRKTISFRPSAKRARRSRSTRSQKIRLLGILDMLWMTNLEDLEALQESVGLRAYAQRDPLVEYRHEASGFFKNFLGELQRMDIQQYVQAGGAGRGGAGTGAARAAHPARLNLNIPSRRAGERDGSRRKDRPERPVPVRQRQKMEKVRATQHRRAPNEHGERRQKARGDGRIENAISFIR